MKKLFMVLIGSALFCACNSPKPEVVQEAAPEPMAFEIGDEKYVAIAKQSLTALAQGNIDGFVADYADNAVFKWSSGDSLANKAAIVSYWKDRRGNVIDTITFENDIWLPIKADQTPPPRPGNWLLNWANFSVTYKNGKNIKMSIHNAFHFNSEDKVDFSIQYVDRAPIQAALAAKKK